MVKAKVEMNGAKKYYRFLHPFPKDRRKWASRWMRKNHPISEVVSLTEAKLVEGGIVTFSGCTIADVYGEQSVVGA
jgi:hypothetical protein